MPFMTLAKRAFIVGTAVIAAGAVPEKIAEGQIAQVVVDANTLDERLRIYLLLSAPTVNDVDFAAGSHGHILK